MVVACGGGTGADTGTSTGALVLSITDAPVDGAEQVVVEFTGVEIQSSTRGRINITYASPAPQDGRLERPTSTETGFVT